MGWKLFAKREGKSANRGREAKCPRVTDRNDSVARGNAFLQSRRVSDSPIRLSLVDRTFVYAAIRLPNFLAVYVFSFSSSISVSYRAGSTVWLGGLPLCICMCILTEELIFVHGYTVKGHIQLITCYISTAAVIVTPLFGFLLRTSPSLASPRHAFSSRLKE